MRTPGGALGDAKEVQDGESFRRGGDAVEHEGTRNV